MLANHVTEEELQQYAEDKAGCPPDITGHIRDCPECAARAAGYQLLFTAIKEEEIPFFDFDLQELVLSQLPEQPRPAASQDNDLIYLLVAFAILLTGGMLYLFRNYLITLFTNLSFISILIVVILVPLLITQGMDMYRIYQKKMQALDIY